MVGKRGDFWSKVSIDNPDSCWLWKGAKMFSRDVRGYLKKGKKNVFAHREAWELTNGPIPDGLCVCHTCDTTLCCNPGHLFLGTQKQNIADRDSKGRCRAKGPIGEKNGTAKLSNEQAEKVISLILANQKSQGEIAREFGISASIVSRIKHGKAWKHLLIQKAKGAK